MRPPGQWYKSLIPLWTRMLWIKFPWSGWVVEGFVQVLGCWLERRAFHLNNYLLTQHGNFFIPGIRNWFIRYEGILLLFVLGECISSRVLWIRNQRRTRNPMESWPHFVALYHSFPNCSRLFRLSGNSVLRWQISGAFRRFQGGLRKQDETWFSSPPRVGQDSKLKTQPANSFFEFFRKGNGP